MPICWGIVILKRPGFSVKTFLKGKYQKKYEEWLNDRFVCRDSWSALAANLQAVVGKNEINGVYLGTDGYLLEKYQESEFDENQVRDNVEFLSVFLNHAAKQYGEKQKYTTDENGQIKLEDTAVGEYTSVVTRVPSGYHADRTAFTSVVKANVTTEEKIQIRTEVKGKTTTKQTDGGGNTSGGKKQDTAVDSAEGTSQPETGDRFDARVPVVLFLLAIAGMVAAFVLRRKESSCR